MLPPPPGNIRLRQLLLRHAEQIGRLVELHQPPQPEEAGPVRGAGGLLHVVGDDDDGIGPGQFAYQVLDIQCRHRVKS